MPNSEAEMDDRLHNTTAKNYHRNTEDAIERGTYLLWTRQSQPLSTVSCVETGSGFYSDNGAQLEHLPEQVDLIPSPVANAPQRIACGRLRCYSFGTSTVGGESATSWNTVLRRLDTYLIFRRSCSRPTSTLMSTILPRQAAPTAQRGTRESLLVIIPSRLQRTSDGDLMLRKAIASVLRQSAASLLDIDLVIGVDPGATVPTDLDLPRTVRFVEAGAPSQAAALNAAARSLDHTYLAILEDDDEWHSEFLGLAIEALKCADFVSSTQLEVETRGENICIFDFPTPSGWVMRHGVWERVGPFDEAYHFHLDNEWLGRLAEAGARRSHFIEATAPVDAAQMAVIRPDLHRVVTQGGPCSTLLRHHVPIPLVRRAVHPGSSMHAVWTDPEAQARFREESAKLRQRYGHVPW